MKRRQLALAATALAALTLAAPALRAQDKPPIKILVGFPPGGSADVVARVVADKMRVSLGQNVIVDNKPGAGGRVVLGELKRAAPDGQVLVFSPSGALVIQPWLFKNLGYDPARDFTPIAQASTFDFALTVGPGAPAGTDVKGLFAWMKANPGKANYATSGAGTVPHFAGQLIGQAAGVPMTHVAYKGGAPAAQDLMGGQVPLMVDTASETIEQHKAGKVRIIAVTGEARSKSLPDVPTLRELGYNVQADAFFGLYGPAGMAPELASRLSRAVADALRQPDVQEKIYGFGLVPAYATSEQLAAIQAAHYKRWEEPIKASGFKAE
ncbi:Bug family tripartite tricarboxylate transporter substrate binding protein [Variovorax terrae]|uniref:Bug family tripartite tricarboxylate transporter substrate binding protein n=1 Tax=Variovorax terrae TaxID=2923278 RepID=A0A9X1W1H7_9BURK|nr:Bug family tripartite tricarboxylate transporter substrate binding protein [Variovorax terrae]MCJ0766022.1 Bug family tripartite tricarboxylate transporter substrate binding protein [Variovorax terrae]